MSVVCPSKVALLHMSHAKSRPKCKLTWINLAGVGSTAWTPRLRAQAGVRRNSKLTLVLETWDLIWQALNSWLEALPVGTVLCF
jgi:hypothetical protein